MWTMCYSTGPVSGREGEEKRERGMERGPSRANAWQTHSGGVRANIYSTLVWDTYAMCTHTVVGVRVYASVCVCVHIFHQGKSASYQSYQTAEPLETAFRMR